MSISFSTYTQFKSKVDKLGLCVSGARCWDMHRGTKRVLQDTDLKNPGLPNKHQIPRPKPEVKDQDQSQSQRPKSNQKQNQRPKSKTKDKDQGQRPRTTKAKAKC
jgi:hypothetical protein